MGNAIHTKMQRNLWGTTNALREPQRTDLWYVDFTNALSQINSALRVSGITGGIDLGSWQPQYARSISWPSTMVKAEAYLQDNIPIQQPAEDEPLGEIKISFIWDTAPQTNNSYITQFLQIWHDLVRAGRGARYQGFQGSDGSSGETQSWIPLDDYFQINCNFDVAVVLLRGGSQKNMSSAPSASDTATIRALEADSRMRAKVAKQISDAQKTGRTLDSSIFNVSTNTSTIGTTDYFTTPNLEIAAAYRICRMWLAGYKLPDLDYEASKLGTIEATFYASAIIPLESATVVKV